MGILCLTQRAPWGAVNATGPPPCLIYTPNIFNKKHLYS